MSLERFGKDNRSENLLMRISARQKAAIKLAAIEEQTTVSNFMRSAAIDKIMEKYKNYEFTITKK